MSAGPALAPIYRALVAPAASGLEVGGLGLVAEQAEGLRLAAQRGKRRLLEVERVELWLGVDEDFTGGVDSSALDSGAL